MTPNTVQQNVAILGATGSVGASALDVIARHPERYRVSALTAGRNWEALLELIERFRPPVAAMRDPHAAHSLRRALSRQSLPTRVVSGAEGLREVAELSEVDTVIAAIVGATGLESTLAAARSGKRVLLANKETLVLAGQVFMSAVREFGATLLPIDSEHNAIFQCLPHHSTPGQAAHGVRRILLTASGGPFRNTPFADLENVTPEEACAHPTWRMGRKISVDSATMMNKGLEVIEAHWLFAASRGRHRGGDSSGEHRPLDGRICRWLGARATRQSRHANAHRPGPGVAGAYRRRRRAARPRANRIAQLFRSRPGALSLPWSGVRLRCAPEAPARRRSTPPTKSPWKRFWNERSDSSISRGAAKRRCGVCPRVRGRRSPTRWTPIGKRAP